MDTLAKEQVSDKIVLNKDGTLTGNLGWYFQEEALKKLQATDEQNDEQNEEPKQETNAETSTEPNAKPDAEQMSEAENTDQQQFQAGKEVTEEGEYTQPKDKYYTIEEIKEHGITKLDPNKIPDELKPFYKSMQADYTRKTQQIADLKKEVYSFIDSVAKKPLKDIPQDIANRILEQADSMARQKLGDVDEFDSNYLALKNLYTQDLVTEYRNSVQKEQVLTATEQILKRLEPNYYAIEQLALQALYNMPFEQANKYIQAKEEGNVEPLLELFETARVMFYSANRNNSNQVNVQTQQIPQQQQPQKKQEPPKVEGSGSGEIEQPKKRISAKDLKNKSIDEQADFLIKLGLV